ncbi:MAG TPA: enoyl-CoA hydratase/isomerase family protein [Bacteroidota bacterium]|nr:enoyl-CoA hydratase/isomerase family protein [Bacteroidota bacterium]
MTLTAIKYSSDQHIATIELPDETSQVTTQIYVLELTKALAAAQKDDNVKAVLLISGGEQWYSGINKKNFSNILKSDFSQNLQESTEFTKVLQQIYTLRKPVVTKVRGEVSSISCGVVTASDIVIASRETSWFSFPDIHYGILPAAILYFLMKRVGETKAREIFFQARRLTAEEALHCGLATFVVPDVELEKTTHQFLTTLITHNSSTAMGLLKEFLFRIQGMSVADSLEYASNLSALSRMTDDSKKGMESFLNDQTQQW